jgi:hypothetical protein
MQYVFSIAWDLSPKSSIFSNKNVRENLAREICQILSLKQSHSHDIYLGIPMNSTKSNKEALLEVVIERIKDGWKMEVYNVPCLIKYVGTALPQY